MSATSLSAADLGSLADAVARAGAYSPFLRERIAAQPDLVATLERNGIRSALAAARDAAAEHRDAAARLRVERGGVATVLALADLAGIASLEETVEALTAFADVALDAAIREAFLERSGSPHPRGFVAIGLGKQGSRELNYSSDIDPIFLFDPATLSLKPREDAQTAAVRIARRVVDLLQTRTGEGYVLRVDLRLRPSPEVSPVALPVEAALSYYESSALPWERAAFIRARAAAGDIALGESFLAAISPFVWRRTLDFGAIAEITAISRRIRDEHRDSIDYGPGYDLKRGRGGIREIEFFVQVHQLIQGGRDPSLRAPATLDALAALRAAGHVSPEDADALSSTYRMLRTVEHRLQMVDDRQTHVLPEGDALDAVARLAGHDGAEALLAMLGPHTARVREIYDRLEDGAACSPSLPEDDDALGKALARLGFADPAPVARLIGDWRQGGARSLRSSAARAAFEAMLPSLIEAAADVPDPQTALFRFDDIVTRVPSGINLYRLIEARPALLTLLVGILGAAPALAEQLGRRPELLDGLIDASAFDAPPEVDDLLAEFERAAGSDSYERAVDAIRRRVNERRFALGAQLVSGRADPLDVAAGYARVAEAAIRALGGAAVREFSTAHGAFEGGELAIVGLGRLGGGAMTHASDLDLVYLFTGEVDCSSSGVQPLRATDYFNRLARRVSAALGTPTAAGPLYEVDTRLRPQGSHGMLAVSLDGFLSYQCKEAWTFEHMALTRARAVFGSAKTRVKIDRSLTEVLMLPRDRERVLADAAAMRAEIARHKPSGGDFDIKRGNGGLIDLEFAVHGLQLSTGAGLDPHLGSAIANLIDAGLAPPAIAEHHRLLSRLLVTLRLVAPGGGDPAPAAQELIARACRQSDWEALVAAHAEARCAIAAFWASTMSPN